MQTRPQSWSTTSTTFTWTVGTCTSLVLLSDRLILIGLRYSLEMEVRRLNSVGAVVWTGALFLCSSVWRPSYCDCLISHRCECRRWSATLLRSLCDKQLPNKHIQSGAPISWSRRTGLKSSGGWGGDWIVYSFALFFTSLLGNAASFISALLTLSNGPRRSAASKWHCPYQTAQSVVQWLQCTEPTVNVFTVRLCCLYTFS